MTCYSISYDLQKPGQDYSRLISYLERLGAVRVEYSLWLLRSNWTAIQILNGVAPYIDANDRLLVAALDGNAAWYNLIVSDNSVQQIIAA
jgi:hypothetical protein